MGLFRKSSSRRQRGGKSCGMASVGGRRRTARRGGRTRGSRGGRRTARRGGMSCGSHKKKRKTRSRRRR